MNGVTRAPDGLWADCADAAALAREQKVQRPQAVTLLIWPAPATDWYAATGNRAWGSGAQSMGLPAKWSVKPEATAHHAVLARLAHQPMQSRRSRLRTSRDSMDRAEAALLICVLLRLARQLQNVVAEKGGCAGVGCVLERPGMPDLQGGR